MSRGEAFHFADFTLDVGERQLLRSGSVIRLSPKALDVLAALVRQPRHLVTKAELLADVWPESFVEEGILTVHISALRKALGDDTRPPAYIETVARSGYRFIAPVTRGTAHEEPSAPNALARSAELYELVGCGRSHLLSGSYFELPDAVEAFRAAIKIDSTYAPAHAGLARARCAQAALRALAMDSASADAQVALGTVLFLSEWDWDAAERSLFRALDINPDHTEALVQYGSLLEALGRLDEGLRFKQQALARDPRSALVLVHIAHSYWNQRKYDETLVWAQRTLAVDPKHPLASGFLAAVYLKVEDIEKFVAENLRIAATFGVSDEALVNQKQVTQLQEAYEATGLAGMMGCMADQITNERLDFDHLLKIALRRAVLYGAAGRLDEAFDCLDQAIAFRDPALVQLAVGPQWDSLRGDPRFGERLRAMRL